MIPFPNTICLCSLLVLLMMRPLDSFSLRIFQSFAPSMESSKTILYSSISDDNIYMPWTLEDDKMLYELYVNKMSLLDMCQSLKRGEVGVKSRIKHILDPEHKAFHRLFGGSEVSTKLSPFRPCKDVIERILWDPILKSSDFSFAYKDRFEGVKEVSCTMENTVVKGKERLFIKAIPEHRILWIKYKSRIVWRKSDRVDLFFGKNTDGIKIEDVVTSYDSWLLDETSIESQLLQSETETEAAEDYLEGYDVSLLLSEDDS